MDNIEAVQWGKLLINLGNAINALSDLPLLTQLQDRAWRQLMADQMAEALRILSTAGIKPGKNNGCAAVSDSAYFAASHPLVPPDRRADVDH